MNSATTDSVDGLSRTIANIRDARATRREAAIRQIALLERLHREFTTALELARGDVTDPITKEPLMAVRWTPVHESGASLTVNSLGRYSFVLEVLYEYGERVAHGAHVDGVESDDVRQKVFGGFPLRLKLAGDNVVIERRPMVNDGNRAQEEDIAGVALLGRFASAVALAEHLR